MTFTTQLSHYEPDTRRRVTYLRARADDDPPAYAGSTQTLETVIHDARASSQSHTLDESAFALVPFPTALNNEDFYSERVVSDYYAEMQDLLKKHTGATHAKIFHHQVRCAEKSDASVAKDGSFDTSTSVQGYAHGIHTDSSGPHAETLWRHFVQGEPAECRSGRFVYINAWRNISSSPIEQDHLAVLDERSLVKPDDYVHVDLKGVGYDVLQYGLSSRNAGRHRWFYFPKMVRDEVLLFKQYDSDCSKSGRCCFHTAVRDPTARADAPPRESIEVRAILFFANHEGPNTCPVLPAEEGATDDGCDEARAREGATKLAGACTFVKSNAMYRAMVQKHMKADYETGGALAVIRKFADDEQGTLGLKSASAETKERAAELAFGAGLATRDVDEIFCGPSAAVLFLQSLQQSRLAAAMAGCAIGALVAGRLSQS